MEDRQEWEHLLYDKEVHRSQRYDLWQLLKFYLHSSSVHLCFACLTNFCLCIAFLWAFYRSADPSIRLFSPANDAIEYENVVFFDSVNHASPYEGEPDKAKDEMWNDLYRNTSVLGIDPALSTHLPSKTVVHPQTGEGLIALEVFHQV